MLRDFVPDIRMNYAQTTLHNGLRLLTTPMPGMRSASIAFFFTVGSRYERKPVAGVSHFIEHMLFKGSQRYPTARLISEAIEGVGGVFNAVIETTFKVLQERRNKLLTALMDIKYVSHYLDEAISRVKNILLDAQADIPFFALFA